MQISNDVIDIAIKAIRDEIGRLEAGIWELLLIKKSQEAISKAPTGSVRADEKPPIPRKKKTTPAEPIPKRPAAIRRFATQVDIVRVLEHAGEPLTEFKIKESLDELLNVKPCDAALGKVLNPTSWREGAKRYRKNVNGEYELYEPRDDE
jgi:hypothetical protein